MIRQTRREDFRIREAVLVAPTNASDGVLFPGGTASGWRRSDRQIVGHAGRHLTGTGTFLQKLGFGSVPKPVHPAAGLACGPP
jgi:hypothetical protein